MAFSYGTKKKPSSALAHCVINLPLGFPPSGGDVHNMAWVRTLRRPVIDERHTPPPMPAFPDQLGECVGRTAYAI